MSVRKKYPFGVLGMKNTFKDVLDTGVKFDNTINSKYTFGLLRKSDLA